jgi:hypothetical protein
LRRAVQTIDTRVLNSMNSRNMEIFADRKLAFLDGKMTAIVVAAPKGRTLKVEVNRTSLDQARKEV